MAEQMYEATGMEEFGLLSLSTSDYPRLHELVERANQRFASRHVSVSLPSLRVDKMLQHIPSLVNSVRKSGLTVAVEAARDDMRAAIRKRVTDGDLLDGVRQAYEAGWRSVKLYFMCGFPGERADDIDGIVHLCRQVSEARRAHGVGPAAVRASVGWLVPKPHTPLQWAAQPTAEYFHDARRRLTGLLKAKKGPIRIRTHNVERSVLEAVFSRGDRRLAPVIEHAYRAGARFEGWDECFDADRWQQAFEATGVDPAFYAHRERAHSEVLPWAHLIGPIPTDTLWREYLDLFAQLGTSPP